MGYSVRIELTSNGLLAKLARHYVIQGALYVDKESIAEEEVGKTWQTQITWSDSNVL